jgi:pilin isopeptide linkage protein
MKIHSFFKKANLLCMALLLGIGLRFSQTYAAEPASAAVTLKVQTLVEGEDLAQDPEFTFLLEAEGNAPLPEKNTVTIQGAGEAIFEEISYTKPGEYQYTITQTTQPLDNYTLDTAVYYVDVYVMNQEEEEGLYVSAIVWKNEKSAKSSIAVFTNEYHSPEVTPTPEITPTPQATPTPETTPTPSSGTPSTPGNTPKSNVSSPKTGDSTNLMFWILLIAGAGISATAAAVTKKMR